MFDAITQLLIRGCHRRRYGAGVATESSTSPAVGRALDILTYLAHRTGTVEASSIARDLGLPRSSTYHILTVLAARGFVVYVPEARGYALGAAAHHLGNPYDAHDQLERLARPVMQGLAERLGIVVHLGVLRGNHTLYLRKEHPSRDPELEPALITAVGVLLPAHLTANGRAMLAHLGSANLDALYARPSDFVTRTGRGPRSLPELASELAVERQRGWSEEVGLVTPGLRSAGAAVFDLHGLPVAALSCTWRSRVALRTSDAVVAALRAGASELTRRMQGREPGRPA